MLKNFHRIVAETPPEIDEAVEKWMDEQERKHRVNRFYFRLQNFFLFTMAVSSALIISLVISFVCHRLHVSEFLRGVYCMGGVSLWLRGANNAIAKRKMPKT